MKTNKHAGQHKLRGKRTKHLSCRCCLVSDLRGGYFWRLAAKEARQLPVA